jgi:hypothetical protein
MAEDKKQLIGGPSTVLPLIAVLAILTGWFVSYQSSYEEERPPSYPLKTLYYPAAQDVEARLWQDPFAAVEGLNEANEKAISGVLANKTPCDFNSHKPCRIYLNHQNNQDITILVVTMPGGSFQETSEQRMRWRYSVLSALANQDIFPQDPQHIGYVQLNPNSSLQKKLPFEWWSRSDEKSEVLLLWVDESTLFGCPADKLKELLHNASPNNVPNHIQYKVIGPNSSTTLRDLLKEVKADNGDLSIAGCTGSHNHPTQDTLGKIKGKSIEYYSAGATSSDELLLKGIDTQSATISQFLSDLGITLNRTTARDNDMLDVLVHELVKRKVEDSDYLILLSEWDTFYGRAMPEAFEKIWRNHHVDETKFIRYSYMRGLDGKLPDKGDKVSNGGEKKNNGKDKNSAEASIELPEGQNQKDYLRRLTANILGLDQKLKDEGNNKGVAAIGVLGSDVHDKLMILEALRQSFPHKLFFTTDVDAAYRHAAKLPQTHNLLVASAFDLKLRPELQGQIPPFRDSYQTAVFLATQMALVDEISVVNQIGIPPARLFEVGRNHLISLPTNNDKVLPVKEFMALTEDKQSNCSWDDLTKCTNDKRSQKIDVQPPIYATYWFKWTLTGLFAVLLLVIAPLFVSWSMRKVWREYLVSIAVILTLACLLLNLWWNDYIIKADAEPFYWLEGLSIWPSQLLRLSTLLFALGFFWWGIKRIKKMQTDLQAGSFSHSHEAIFSLPDIHSEIGGWNSLFVGSWKEKFDEKATISPDLLWEKYLGYSRPKNAVYRMIIHSIFFLSIAFLLINIDPPNVPTRGNLSYIVNLCLLTVLVVVTILLTLWVVDNARLCERLTYNLSRRPSLWNANAHAWVIHKNKVAHECVDDWLDIQLVLRLTESLQQLIWGPMVCIVLLVLARSPAVDDWGIPWGLGAVFIIMIFYLISAEVFLQSGATNAREKAIDQLTGKIIAEDNKIKPNETVIKRIEAEIERIKLLRRGAFRPWYELPLIQSMGGLSTFIFVMQYLAGVWGNGAL